MENLTKLTAEELQFVQQGTADYKAIKNNIGDLEIKKANLLKQADLIIEAFRNNEKALIEKYGETAIINMQTGDVTHKEEKKQE